MYKFSIGLIISIVNYVIKPLQIEALIILKKNKANLIVNENKALHSLFFAFDWTFRQNLRQFLS